MGSLPPWIVRTPDSSASTSSMSCPPACGWAPPRRRGRPQQTPHARCAARRPGAGAGAQRVHRGRVRRQGARSHRCRLAKLGVAGCQSSRRPQQPWRAGVAPAGVHAAWPAARLGASRSRSLMTDLTRLNSSRPSRPCTRPNPDHFSPPKGSDGIAAPKRASLMFTPPATRRVARSFARRRSRLKTLALSP